VHDVAYTFAERWNDPARIDSPTPWRRLLHRAAEHPDAPGPLAADRTDGDEVGTHAVQVLRTYPARRPPYPFAPEGERSIARAYEKAFGRARRLIYVEDQYLWSLDATRTLARALRREPHLHLVMVIPRHPDPDGAIAGAASNVGRERVLDELLAAGGDRVAVYDLENTEGTPIYVHAKVCVIDDIWMAVGSDNLNRRSWTHDSELSCAIVDAERDERAPQDPAGRGEGARRLARTTRVRAAAEHLGRADADVADLVDPEAWFTALRDAAAALDSWHDAGCIGPRPSGHLRRHPRERVSRLARPLLHWVHARLLDPDGRPAHLRRAGEL
jgi:phosphatidylserine/phosphatidylglycerophosphate/cardiolipin synthase-like enzyme